MRSVGGYLSAEKVEFLLLLQAGRNDLVDSSEKVVFR